MKNNLGINLGIILGTALASKSCSTVRVVRNEKCIERESEKKSTYTEFKPNPKNNQYKKKFLGVKNKRFKP